MTAGEPIDIGHGHALRYFIWSPDRELNPQYADLPDVDPAGAIVMHIGREGKPCEGAINFDVPQKYKDAWHPGKDRPYWGVETLDPLTISPSVLCLECGDHGFIRGGRWVPA